MVRFKCSALHIIIIVVIFTVVFIIYLLVSAICIFHFEGLPEKTDRNVFVT